MGMFANKLLEKLDSKFTGGLASDIAKEEARRMLKVAIYESVISGIWRA
jgi:hypothetical protein